MAYLVDDARALGAGQYQHIIIYGTSAIADGGGGFYLWSPTSTDADDGVLWIRPNSVDAGDPGRWQRIWAPPVDIVSSRATVTETGATRTNTAADAANWVRFTNTGAKTPTVSDNIAAAGDAWIWVNVAATGKLTIGAGAGVTLTGNLVFDPLKAALIRFSSPSAADVIGGTAT